MVTADDPIREAFARRAARLAAVRDRASAPRERDEGDVEAEVAAFGAEVQRKLAARRPDLFPPDPDDAA